MEIEKLNQQSSINLITKYKSESVILKKEEKDQENDKENDEVAAFEELVGSHGGLGGTQTKPFIMHPIYWKINDDLIGAESIYHLLKRELENLKENDN